MFHLECTAPLAGARFALRRGESVLGRAPGSEILMPDPSLSRRHAALAVDDGGVVVRDLGSHNGTRVNGVTITAPTPLRPGDTLRCGDVSFVLREERLAPPSPAGPTDPRQTVALRSAELPTDPQARRLATLLRVAELLARPGKQLPSRILELAAEILPIDRAVLLVLEPDGTLRTAASRHLGNEARPYSESVVRHAITHRVAVQFDDAQADLRLNDAESVVAQAIRCALCAPLVVDDRVLGAIYVDNRVSTHAFSPADLELLAGFANQAAAAVNASHLQAALERAAVRQSTFERFFPPATAARLVESGGELGVQELEVTALFSDISGFTQLGAVLPPREVVALLHAYFPPMARIVFERQGTLEKYIGDALLAVWGAPYPDPEDADRAVRAAVEMQQALARLRPSLPHPIQIHVGLHSGRVALANIGSAEYLQVATIGDATNTSARVCSVAGEGEIVVTQATVDRMRQRPFPLVPLPPTLVKGKAEPLVLYRVEWR